MNWYTYSKLLMDKCKEQEIPYHVGFELTPYCNFNCNMCYVHLTAEEAQKYGKLMTSEQWIFLAQEAKKLGALSLEITGGEALTRPDFPILYKKFMDLGYLIVLRTNGYLVKGDVFEFLNQYKPRVIMITLYGASDKTYENVCGIKDGFSVVTENILALRQANIPVRLSSTITSDNFGDVSLMQEWARKHGFELSLGGHLFTPMRGTNRDIDHLQIRYPKADYEIPEALQPTHRDIPDLDKYINPFWMCRAFGAKFSITWDGKMVLCYSNPSVWTDPFATTLADAYHALYREMKSVHRPAKCRTCNYIDLCTVCPSMLYSATGSMEQTNYEMCKFAYRNYKNIVLHQNHQINSIPCELDEEGDNE